MERPNSKSASADRSLFSTKRTLKYVVAFVVILFAVLSTILSQQLQTRYKYTKTLFLFFCHSTFLIVGLISYWMYFTLTRNMTPNEVLRYDLAAPSPQEGSKKQQDLFVTHIEELTQISRWQLMSMSLPFTFCWFGANYSFLVALSEGDVASCMSLEQCTTVFIFILSIPILKERVTWQKVLSVLICIGGVVCLAFGDRQENTAKNPVLGDCLVLISSFAAAVYMVAFKKYLPPFSLPALTIWLGAIGIVNVVLFSPLLMIADLTGWEVFGWPDPGWPAALLVLSSLCSFIANWLLNFGIVVSTPLFVRVSIICAIPITFVVSMLIDHTSPSWMRLVGASMIVLGFVAFAFASERSTTSMPATEDHGLLASDPTQLQVPVPI